MKYKNSFLRNSTISDLDISRQTPFYNALTKSKYGKTYLCNRGMNPLRLLDVPGSDADQILLAGLELRRVGKEGVGGWPVLYRICVAKGDSGDGTRCV